MQRARSKLGLVLAFGVTLAAWCSGEAAAAILRVDLDVGTGNTQAGFESWFLTAANATIGAANYTNSFTYPVALGSSVQVTMTTGGDTYTRLYSTVTSPLEAVEYDLLLRDLLFFNQRRSGASYFQVQLDNLLAGHYEFTAWHNSSNTLNGHATTDVLVSAGGSPLADTGVKAVFRAASSSGVLPAGAPFTSAIQFDVPNDGDSVVIRYANPTADHFGLNAFSLGTAVSPIKIWNGADGMDWNTTNTSWTGATWQGGDTATFAGAGTGTINLTEDAVHHGTMTFRANGYTIAGNNTITMANSPVIDVAGGVSAAIHANLAGTGGLTVQGGGTLTFGGSATPAGNWLKVLEGTTFAIAGGGDVRYGALELGGPDAQRPSLLQIEAGGSYRSASTGSSSLVGTAANPYAAIVQKGGYAGFSLHLYLGHAAGSDASYDLEGGHLDIGGSAALVIGSSGKATLVQSGGEVTARRSSGIPLYIGEQAGSNGTLHINGGTFTVAGHDSADVRMANAGNANAMLTIDGPDAGMRIRRHLYLTDSTNATATVNLLDGELAVDGVFRGGSAGTAHFNMAGGTLRRYSADGGTRTWVGFDTAARNFDINLSGTGSTISASDLSGGDAEINLYANLTGNGEIIFSGGTVNVRGANSHTGPTTVAPNTTVELMGNSNLESSATVMVNGILKSAAGIRVVDGQTYGGTGTIDAAAAINAGGSLSPGESIGLLSFADELTLHAGATLLWDFVRTGYAGEDYDSLTGTSLIVPNDGRVNLDIRGLIGHPDYSLRPGDQFTLFHGDVYEAGAATPFAFGAELDDYFNVLDHGIWWGTWELNAGSLILTAVPEPGAALLMLWTLACGLLVRRRRR